MTRRAAEITPSKLRLIAADLLRISDELDAEIHDSPSSRQNDISQPTSDMFFSRQDSPLEAVHAIYRERRRRKNFFPSDLFGEPAWDILLDLFASRLEGRLISVTSACIGSDVPLTTALRWLKQLEELGLIERTVSENDHRVTWVQLSDYGSQSMEEFFHTSPNHYHQRDVEVSDRLLMAKGFFEV